MIAAHRRLARTLGAGAAALTAAAVVTLPGPALAGALQPAPLTGIHVVSTTHNSFTVGLNPSAQARTYKVFASLDKHQMPVAKLSSAPYHATSATNRITVGSLPYSTNPYYYRVEALNGTHHRYSTTYYSVGLLPSPPTSLTVHSTGAGTWLTWAAPDATGAEVEQATNAGFSAGVREYKLRNSGTTFTPFGVKDGSTYYWRVRSTNGDSRSSYTAAVTATVASHAQPVRFMTYNVLEANFDGTTEGGQKVAPWSKRRLVAARLIKEGDPAVVAIQEAGVKVNAHTLQVTSLQRALGKKWAVAKTEPPLGVHGHPLRTAQFLIYQKAIVKAIGKGGIWQIGTHGYHRQAAYQEFRVRASGARFLAVSPHLQVGHGAKFDKERRRETARLIGQARARAAKLDAPIVFGGDYNSSLALAYNADESTFVMLNHHMADAFGSAQKLTNAKYDSDSQYRRKPIDHGTSVDHVYTTPGVAIRTWREIVHLKHGRFVGVMASDHCPIVVNLAVPY